MWSIVVGNALVVGVLLGVWVYWGFWSMGCVYIVGCGCREIWRGENMKMRYKVIYVDPPWSHDNRVGGCGNSGAASHYEVMTMQELLRMDVGSLVDDDAFLFMWWVASMPEEALRVVKAWGFTLKTMTAFSWIKKTVRWKDHFGMGFYTRQQQEKCLLACMGDCDEQENCLIARVGKPKVASHSVRQNIRAVVRKHSQKPDEVRDRIVELCGDVPRLELFATSKVEGWDSWGYAVGSDVEMRFKV
jgi:N6-adenosine-specific RNA methylase IME4